MENETVAFVTLKVRAYRLRSGVVGFAEELPGGYAFVWSYLLHDADSAVLIDAGVSRTAAAVMRWFADNRRLAPRLRALLLTHGHSDHIQGVGELARRTNAPVYLHPADRDVAAGTFAYRGWGRIGGALEAAGRISFDCRPLLRSSPLVDGQEFPWFGGMRVVALPGHTPGHVGFHVPAWGLLFCGDAVLYLGKLSPPHRFFNWDERAVAQSFVKLLDFDVDLIYPMHHFGIDHNLQTDVRGAVERAKRRQSANAVC